MIAYLIGTIVLCFVSVCIWGKYVQRVVKKNSTLRIIVRTLNDKLCLLSKENARLRKIAYPK